MDPLIQDLLKQVADQSENPGDCALLTGGMLVDSYSQHVVP
ncbi:MAG: hypothetical protein ACT4P5_23490 [Armatimonadota bacterium]